MEVGQAVHLKLNSAPRALQYIRLKDSDKRGIKILPQNPYASPFKPACLLEFFIFFIKWHAEVGCNYIKDEKN